VTPVALRRLARHLTAALILPAALVLAAGGRSGVAQHGSSSAPAETAPAAGPQPAPTAPVQAPAAQAPPDPADPDGAEVPLLAPHASGFPFVFPDTWSEALTFDRLPGWMEDRQDWAMRPFLVSCRQILERREPPRAAPAVWRALREICPRALALPQPVDLATARAFFEAEFRPVRIARFAPDEERDGFLTGYYEPEVAASRERAEGFTAPVLARPDDLVPARGRRTGGFDARGGAGRWVDGRFMPYFDRGEIEEGALAGRGLEIAWLRDETEVMFAQIQGSARLRFTDGTALRIGYSAHNGHRYVPVGRVLIERGLATREEMSMDFIRTWMAANPEEARDVRRQNRSYVFFHVRNELSAEDGPVGGQGVPISDWRSLAVDRNVHAYGTPVYVDGLMPTGMTETLEPWRRLMVAQDTGSAIVGPARGDLFIGTGFEAGSIAGRIRHRADWFVLLPLRLAPQAARVPVPQPRRPPPPRHRDRGRR
jgi:membrane-bound lytic murein transglycosylase A